MIRESKNIIVGKLDRTFSIITTVLLILSCGPFFMLGGHSTIVNLFFSGIYIFLYMIIIHRKNLTSSITISRYNYNNFVVSIFFFCIIFIPFRQFDKLVAVSIWGLVFLLFILLDKRYLTLVSKVFSNVIFYITCFVILIWTLLVLGIELPFWEYSTGLSDIHNKSTFFIYPGTVVLQGQDFELFGSSVYRMSGIFSEPGHYGIICFFAYLMSTGLSRLKKTVIILGSILSFSMGAYVLWVGYLLITNRFAIKRKLILIILLVCSLLILYIYLPQEILERFIFNKIASEDTLNNRTGFNFANFYKRDHDFIQYFLGYGRLVFDEFNLFSSDYRGFQLRYGIIGILMCFIWVLTLYMNGSRKNLLMLFFVAIVVFIHRAWLIDYFIFYFILYYISKNERL